MALTSDQVKVIKATVPVVQQHGDSITTVFYKKLLQDNPALKDMFNTVNQSNGQQAASLAKALYAYAVHIDDLGVLSPFVERVCQKHAALYVQRAQYDVVGTYLLAAMKQVLGDSLTPEIHDAWAAAYVQLANLMADREDQLYKENEHWTSWRDFKIVKKVSESSEITSFYLEPVDGESLPSFRPGQYLTLRVEVPALRLLQPRHYSLSDKPDPRYYRISVKKEPGLDSSEPCSAAHPGYISNILHDMKKEGDVVQVSHPQGEFFLSELETNSKSPVVLLCAGVGLTPMMSMLNYLTSPEQHAILEGRTVHFIHGTRSNSVQAFREQVRTLQEKHPDNIKCTFFNKDPTPEHGQSEGDHYNSRVDMRKLDLKEDLHTDDEGTEYYICGPTSFMTDIKKNLESYGVGPERIKLELFGTGDI